MTPTDPSRDYPVIGIGASAGGLDALQRLFGALGERLGAAVLVVQHLDPSHPSIMHELIARRCDLSVREATDGDEIRPDAVYTAPPGMEMTVANGRIRISERSGEAIGRAPIDSMLRSLAAQYGARSVGVVLSGTGTDGSRGLVEIADAGGLVLAQSPEEAEFDGMPRAALSTGRVDFSGAVTELAARLRGPPAAPPRAEEETAPEEEIDPQDLARLLELMLRETGYDFRDYKPGTLTRRIRRRMAIARQESVAGYIDTVERERGELDELVRDMLIGVTRFFRDRDTWDEIARVAIAPVVERLQPGEALRAWVAGCASGEEAYSLAIALTEAVEASGKSIEVQVFGTDVNPIAIETARLGRYPRASVEDIDAERRARWFADVGDEVRVTAELRGRLVFAVQNAVTDPPFSSLDIVSCRNLMIYLEPSAQNRLIETFHFALRPEGVLVLGLSESADRAEDHFVALSPRHRIYRRRSGGRRRAPTPRRPTVREAEPGRPATHFGADSAVQAMLGRFAPPTVHLGEDFELLGLHGDLDGILGFRSGAMTRSFPDMVIEPLRAQVWTALHTARREESLAEMPVNPVREGEQALTLLVEPIQARGRRNYLLYFLRPDAPAPPAVGESEGTVRPSGDATALVANYQAEVMALRQELHTVIEKGETSHEELQAANEEVMSANEELQSSNEELETSREELQSLNQELTTINAELEDKIAQLEATNDDLANLISSTDVATLFLDTDLAIRRFSAQTRNLLAVRDADIGRPLAELSLKVDDPTLLDDLGRVLADLETREAEIDGDGVAYLRRISPFRTADDRIEGAVVTYADVTRLRRATRNLQRQVDRQAIIAELGTQALGSGDVPALFERAAREVARGLGADLVGIERYDADDATFKLLAGHGWARGLAGNTATWDDVRNELGFAFRHANALSTADATADTRFSPSTKLADATGRAGICLPIGPVVEPWGVLHAWWRITGAPSEEDVHFLTAVAGVLWLAIHQAETQRLREGEREELQALIDGLPILIGIVDGGMRFELFNNTFGELGFTPDEVLSEPVSRILGAEAGAAAAELARSDSGEPASAEIAVALPHGERRTYLLYCVPRVAGQPTHGYFLAALDISERKAWEEQNRVMSAELDHRVKNVLALVGTIARMTGRHARNFDEFRRVFMERIDSLSRTHVKLAATNWRGMDLRTLLSEQIEAYASGAPGAVALEGPDVTLSNRSAQTLSLAVHELTTNAARFGALARPAGRLEVVWRKGDAVLEIDWSESGVGPVERPERPGFGISVIEGAILRQLGGDLSTTYSDDGLRCAIRLTNTDGDAANGG
ncbi:PAS [Oceanicola granulosus HTCC2516]|uniref:PAS n=1 Tax=Oceanicola granulosus (strain ATCC BAA-861 / DSM 15982 / KCTC 12143 / HTCC2516) TaxID=314256 RepID=Q2CDY0_OCEGH|nr:chemotaxis protein CheB [Oceanicola granulosus]EAR50848.1 PAS [Oceanicola granulosus HTCC2516]